MNRSAVKQAQIRLMKAEATARYPDLWARIIAEWHSPSPVDRGWLLYSANYLFRTGNVRWALDPVTLRNRLPQASEVDVAHDLSGLSFVLLTHSHADHLDFGLLRALRDFPILWVVPESLLKPVIELGGLERSRLILPRPMEPIRIEGITVVPFDGLHGEESLQAGDRTPSERVNGVPSSAYLVEFNHKRWLFPGDTRTYAASRLPQLDPVDGVLAHLWLGRGCALMDLPPLVEAFCHFYIDLGSRQVIVTHMQELGRQADDFWDAGHFELVRKAFNRIAPDLPVRPAYMGDRLDL